MLWCCCLPFLLFLCLLRFPRFLLFLSNHLRVIPTLQIPLHRIADIRLHPLNFLPNFLVKIILRLVYERCIISQEHFRQTLNKVFSKVGCISSFLEEFLVRFEELVDAGALGGVFLQAVGDEVAEVLVPGVGFA